MMTAYIGDLFWEFSALMERGGMMMWMLWGVVFGFSAIAGYRALFLKVIFPGEAKRLVAAWYQRKERRSWFAHKIRQAALSAMKDRLDHGQGVMKALVAVCPLIGLLGTVVGMMSVFDVLTATGNNDARAIASGVAQATITTMAGMVGALSGLFLMSIVQRLSDNAYKTLEARLEVEQLEEFHPAE